ncbi:MAG: ATP-binding protein [Crocinitomicaceae bacterium]
MEERVTISSSTAEIAKVESLIDKVCESNNFSEDHYGNVLIAVTEAVNNAIEHGNLNVEEKIVTVECMLSNKVLKFAIKDEGNGFDFNNLPDPTDPENIEKPNGRGIFLMKNLADKVEYFDNGSKVEIEFSL